MVANCHTCEYLFARAQGARIFGQNLTEAMDWWQRYEEHKREHLVLTKSNGKWIATPLT